MKRIAIISEIALGKQKKKKKQGTAKLYFSFPIELQRSDVKSGLIKIAPMQR